MPIERLTRPQQKHRTRANLVTAARTVFLRRGFHGASLDEIAEEAGYTKGAVYSNFAGKDELFLAVLDAHFRARAAAYADVVLDEERIEDSYRAVARFWREANEREPGWSPLVVEFLAHASRDERLRDAALEVRERGLSAIAAVIDRLAERHNVSFRLPTREIARGGAALNRGLGVELLLDPSLPSEVFEELHVAYMKGMTREVHQ